MASITICRVPFSVVTNPNKKILPGNNGAFFPIAEIIAVDDLTDDLNKQIEALYTLNKLNRGLQYLLIINNFTFKFLENGNVVDEIQFKAPNS